MAISFFCPSCGANNSPAEIQCQVCHQDLEQQAVASLLHKRYEILTQVGSGGFGAVYRARDTQEQNRPVAVKQINLKGLSAQEMIDATDAFNREAEFLSGLNHPLLPHIFDRFSDPEHWYLVMNFIDGQTLDDYLQDQAARRMIGQLGLPLKETLEIGQRLCEVLHYLHKQQPPIIFRDLKPGNIMRTQQERFYLIDFGIARRFKPGQAKDTIPFGSPGFASPEQYGREQTTPQADIYSLGALLYCLISGDDPSEHPFQFPPLRLYGVDGIYELDTLIQKMVSLTPDQRPATIEQVQKELELIQQSLEQTQIHAIWTPPIGQTPPAHGGTFQQHILSTTQTRRKTSRRRLLTAGLIAGGVLSAIGIAGVAIHGQIQTAASTILDTDPAVSIPTPNIQEPDSASGQMQSVTLNGPAFWSPDLKYLVVTDFLQQKLEIYEAKSFKLLRTIALPASLDSTMVVQWSPDMSKILLFSDLPGAAVYKVQSGALLFTLPATWTTQTLQSLTNQLTFSGAWSPDGSALALTYIDEAGITHFTVLDANSGKQLFSSTATDYTPDHMAWSPDGGLIALASISIEASNTEPWVVKLWQKDTQQITSTFHGSLTGYSVTWGTQKQLMAVVWAPGGQQLCLVSQLAMWIVNVGKDKQVSSALDNDSGSYGLTYGPIWSPNGTRIATLRLGQLKVYDLASSSTLLPATNTAANFVAFTWSSDSTTIIAVDEKNVLSRWPL